MKWCQLKNEVVGISTASRTTDGPRVSPLGDHNNHDKKRQGRPTMRWKIQRQGHICLTELLFLLLFVTPNFDTPISCLPYYYYYYYVFITRHTPGLKTCAEALTKQSVGLQNKVNIKISYYAQQLRTLLNTVEPHLTVTSLVRKPPHYSHRGSVPNCIPQCK